MKKTLMFLACLSLTACILDEPPLTESQKQQIAQNNMLLTQEVTRIVIAHHGRILPLKQIIAPKFYFYLIIDETEPKAVIKRSIDKVELQQAFDQKWPVYEFYQLKDLTATIKALQNNSVTATYVLIQPENARLKT